MAAALLDGTAIARALPASGMHRAVALEGGRHHVKLRALLKLERLALRYAELPFGSSLLAVARRPGARR